MWNLPQSQPRRPASDKLPTDQHPATRRTRQAEYSFGAYTLFGSSGMPFAAASCMISRAVFLSALAQREYTLVAKERRGIAADRQLTATCVPEACGQRGVARAV